MTSSVDSMYKDNLLEWIYDEHKLITYHYLSVSLGVHINMAKQMLYEFYTEEKQKQKNSKKPGKIIEAIFLISGTQARSEDSSELFKFTTTLCLEEKLEEHKNKLKSLNSVHIYSLQCLLAEDDHSLKLKDAAEEATFLKDMEGRSGVDFGPYKLLKPKEKKKPKVSMEPVKVISVSKQPKEIKSKSTENLQEKDLTSSVIKKEENETEKNGTGTPKSKDILNGKLSSTKKTTKTQVSTKKVTATAQSTTRLKNMFAAAASKPRQVKKEKSPPPVKIEISDESSEECVSEVDSEVEIPQKVSSRTKSSKKKSIKPVEKKTKKQKIIPKKPELSRKRKRIQVFSSSSDEDDNTSDKMESDHEEEDTLPESPIPRKKFQIDSDSEDDNFKESSFKKKKDDIHDTPCFAGKKRVSKTVSKTYMADDGFMLTMKEQVLVSASESEEEKETIVPVNDIKKDNIVEPEEKNNNNKQISPPVKKNTPVRLNNSKSSKSDSQKMKQQSLTSFFKKK